MSADILIESPLFTVKEISYRFNVPEYISFLSECENFMSIDHENFEIMLDSIADQLITYADPNTPIGEIRPKIRLLKELAFFLKNMVSVVPENELS